MDFLKETGELDMKRIDETDYSAFKGGFIEDIDIHLANMILEDETVFKIPILEYLEVDGEWKTKQKIDKDGEVMFKTNDDGTYTELPRFTPESKATLKLKLKNVKNGKHLEIFYKQSKKLGRFYSNESESLTCLARNIRNTIYAYYGWTDYDFVASHPTILTQLGIRLRVKTPCLNEWVDDKTKIVKMLSEHHSVKGEPPLQKDHIKRLVNGALYGGGLECWALGDMGDDGKRKNNGILGGKPEKNEMPMACQNYEDWTKGHTWYIAMKKEVKLIMSRIIKNTPAIKERVAPTSLGLPEWKRDSKTTSYILGIFENDCLYHAYQYGIENELIKPRRANLAYDGFTTPPCEHAYHDIDFHINGVNDYIFEKTGFKMRMEIKPYEDWTIQQDLIDARRIMVVADAYDPSIQSIITEGDIVVAEEEDRNQEYLIWREKHERLHTKIINTNNYFKKLYEIDELGNEVFAGYKVFNRTDLIGAYEHLSYMEGKKKKKFITEWIEDNNIQRKDRTDIIPPPMYCPPDVLNLWRPSDYDGRIIEPENERYNADAVNTWTNHIGIMCNHDNNATDYVLNWFAHLLQLPAVKPETCVVITGIQGTGKTIALDPIKKIMGGGYFETTNPERDVWGTFNPLMASSLLVVLSEVDKRNAFGHDGKIKGLKTDKEITIRNLHQAPYTIRSSHRFIIPTNHPDPVFLEDGQRRDMIIKMSDEKKGDTVYFTNFANLWDIEDNLISLYSYLMKRDISDFDPRRPPKTQYQIDLEGFSRNFVDEFFEWWVASEIISKSEDIDDEGFITRMGSDLYRDYRVWREDNGGKYEMNGAGDLMKKIYTSLRLPEGALQKGKRTSKGQQTKFHIETLKKHYKIGGVIVKDDDSGSEWSETELAIGDIELEEELENIVLEEELENIVLEDAVVEMPEKTISVVDGEGNTHLIKRR
jgi:hypothetical protein